MKHVKAIILALVLTLAGVVYASADSQSSMQKSGMMIAISCCKDGGSCKADSSCCKEGSSCCSSDCCKAGAACCNAEGGCKADAACSGDHACCAAKSSDS
jgi:hypothetical protein